MAGPVRMEIAGALYPVTSRGKARRAIFLNNDDRRRLVDEIVKRAEELMNEFRIP